MANYQLMIKQLAALLTNEPDPIANLANTSALVNQTVDQVNWVGFYLSDQAQEQLTLGPFQGKVACMHIQNGHGVCGTAAQTRQTQVVADVTSFPGYISCDTAAQSELVIPLVRKNGDLYGVFDLDAPIKDRFDRQLVATLEEVARIVMKSID